MIAWLLPAAGGLAALAALPLILHWLTRRQARPLAFPAASLLAQAAGGLTRRDRLRAFAILALRALALAAIGLAVAGPLASGQPDSARPAAIVLDASASMRQVVDGATAFARARAAAARLADALAPRPVLAVIAGGEALRSSPGPEGNAGLAKAALADATPGFGDGDLPDAVALAVRSLGAGGDVYLVSDGSRSALAGLDAAALPEGVRLHLVDAGGGGVNRAVVAIAAEPGLAVAGRPLRLTARIANYGPTPASVPTRLSCGPEVRSATLDIPAGGSASLELTITPTDAGWLSATAEIPGGDALAEDDIRHAAIQVLPGLVAVVAGDGDRADPAGALRPLAAGLAAAGFTVRMSDGPGLAAGSARDAALIATAGLGSTAAEAALAAHLAAGGTWLQVIAADPDAAVRPGGVVPPAIATARLDRGAEGHAPVPLARALLAHPLFEPFAGREAMLGEVAALVLWSTPGGAEPGAEALATWADGNVAVAERRLGDGRWLLLNASTSGVATSLARSEAWPLLCGRLALICAAPQAVDAAVPAGRAIPATWLTDPEGQRSEGRDGRVRPDRPGLWRGDAGRVVAVAVPGSESDLRRIDAGVSRADPVATALARAERRPLWPWLLAAAAVFLLAELLLAGRIATRGSRP